MPGKKKALLFEDGAAAVDCAREVVARVVVSAGGVGKVDADGT